MKFYILYFICNFSLNLISQTNDTCDVIVDKEQVEGIEIKCLNLNSVLYFSNIEQNYTKNIKTKEGIILPEFIIFKEKFPDSILIYPNLIQISNFNHSIPVFPSSIMKLEHLSGIDNIHGYIDDESFEQVGKLDSLIGIDLGVITNNLTKIPKVLYSKNLNYVSLRFNSDNLKITKKIIKVMLNKKSIKTVFVGGVKFY